MWHCGLFRCHQCHVVSCGFSTTNDCKSAGTERERLCDIGDDGTGSNVTPQWFGLQCVTACCDIVTIHLAIYNNSIYGLSHCKRLQTTRWKAVFCRFVCRLFPRVSNHLVSSSSLICNPQERNILFICHLSVSDVKAWRTDCCGLTDGLTDKNNCQSVSTNRQA